MNKYSYPGAAAVVTGAASGMGAELVRLIAREGGDLALIDRDSVGLTAISRELREAYPSLHVSAHVVDLADPGDFADLSADVRREHPVIGLLVNNAGVALGGRVDEVSMADIDWIMTINFRAPVALTKAFLPDLRATPGAHIVNISSLFGLIAPAGQAAYAASKFAIRGFTLALQAELIPEGIGVTVVHPGGIATDIAKNARVGAKAAEDPENVAAIRAEISSLLTMTPEVAAHQILEAITHRRERLVITRRAVLADRVVRLLPVRQRVIIARSLKR